MAPKNPLSSPLNKLKDTALGALKDPKAAAEKAVEQAKGTAALGKMVAEGVAGQVVSRARGRRGSDAPHAESPQGHLHAVPEPAPETTPASAPEPTPEPETGTAGEAIVEPTAADLAAAKEASPADVAEKVAKKAPAKKAAKKAPAKKAPAKKAAKKAPAKKAPAKKAAKSTGGDKLPPRPAESTPTGPKPSEIEPNPEATG